MIIYIPLTIGVLGGGVVGLAQCGKTGDKIASYGIKLGYVCFFFKCIAYWYAVSIYFSTSGTSVFGFGIEKCKLQHPELNLNNITYT